MKKFTFLFLSLINSFLYAEENIIQKLPLLHKAVIQGNLVQVKKLVKAGHDINQLDTLMGNAPIHIAAQTSHTEILKYLLDNGAFVNLKAVRSGQTPLMIASWYSKEKNIKLLFSYPKCRHRLHRHQSNLLYSIRNPHILTTQDELWSLGISNTPSISRCGHSVVVLA